MALLELVRSLCDHLSELSTVELSAIERGGHSSRDVRRDLSRHLVEQFWCCILRRSPHCHLTEDSRPKLSRYSASGILQDVNLSARKKVNRFDQHGGASLNPSSYVQSRADSGADRTAGPFPDVRTDVYVDMALRLHKQVMRQKGLQLELLAFDTLLALYHQVSHIPRSNIRRLSVSAGGDCWEAFSSGEDVLELLCHLSSEPMPCIASLELGRHALLRRGVRQIRHIDMKVMLDHLREPVPQKVEHHKWLSGFWRNAPSEYAVAPRHEPDRWTSAAFNRILASLPSIEAPHVSADSVDLGLQKLTISPLSAGDARRPASLSAWMPAVSNIAMDMPVDEQPISCMAVKSSTEPVVVLDAKAAGNWLPSSLVPSHLRESGTLNERSTELTYASETGSTGGKRLLYDFRPFEHVNGRVKCDIASWNVFCHIDASSMAEVLQFNKWQILPSFDMSLLTGDLPYSGTSAVCEDSLVEAMVGCTIRSLYCHPARVLHSVPDTPVNWLVPVVMCLQGFESDLFEPRAHCLYREDPSLVPVQLHKWLNNDIAANSLSIKSLCMAILDDFQKSHPDDHFAVRVAELASGDFVQFSPEISAWHNPDLDMLMQMECTDLLKGHAGYTPQRVFFEELVAVGSIVRRIKYFVSLIKHLNSIDHYRETLGTALAAYSSAIGSFIYEFEEDVTTVVDTGFSGELQDTLSIYSLVLSRLHRWLKAVSWVADATFAPELNPSDAGVFTFPRGARLVDYVINKYRATFRLWSDTECFSMRVVNRCVMNTWKPYLGTLAEWVTTCSRSAAGFFGDFGSDGHLRVISPFKEIQHVISSSREYCVFLGMHYPAQLPPHSLFTRYLKSGAVHQSHLIDAAAIVPDDTASFVDILGDVVAELHSNHVWLDRKMLEVSRSAYHVRDVLQEIDSFVLLSRMHDLEDIFDDWCSGVSSADYVSLFKTRAVVGAHPPAGVSLKRQMIELTFSDENFASYLFTEETTTAYNAVFHQLCSVHRGLRNVLHVSSWLAMNYRGCCKLMDGPCRSVLRELCLLTSGIHAALSSVEWYLRYIALAPLYDSFVRQIDRCTTFSELLSCHRRFVRAARLRCLAADEHDRCGVLLDALCYCSDILSNGVRDLGFDTLETSEHLAALSAWEPPLRELSTRFTRLWRDFALVLIASREPALQHLATILESSGNYVTVF